VLQERHATTDRVQAWFRVGGSAGYRVTVDVATEEPARSITCSGPVERTPPAYRLVEIVLD
jgi:hypothetical protein